jgi:MoaA/NifB/PqqE/SkfB family radical SAM enzyme
MIYKVLYDTIQMMRRFLHNKTFKPNNIAKIMQKLKSMAHVGKSIIKVNSGNPVPLRVTHITTNICNLRCKYCYAESFTKTKEMPTLEILRMMYQFKKAGTKIWKLGGGEPLLKKDIEKIIIFGKKLGFIMNMDTNGTLVKKNLNVLKRLDNIQISLDGPEQVHDGIRGKGVFKQCMEAFDLLNDVGVKPLINCVISKHNIDHIEYMCNLAKEKNTFINFQPVVPVTKDAQEEFSKEMLDKKIFDKLLELKKTNPHIAVSDASLKQFKAYYEKKIDKFQKNCLAGQIYCIVSPQGQVARCIDELGSKSIDGTKVGFVKAFKQLSKDYSCDCTFCCYYDLSRVYALNPKENLRAACNVMTGKWVYN